MATRVALGLVLVLAAMFYSGAMAQSGCTTTLISLSPCLNYVTGNSSTPSSSCCSQLASVVQSQPQCLCVLVNGGGSSLGISINQSLALSLPAVCNVQTPPVSRCNGVNGPASSPETPADSTPDALSNPSLPNSPAGFGSKTVQNTEPTSDASIKSMQPVAITISVALVASYATNIIKFKF